MTYLFHNNQVKLKVKRLQKIKNETFSHLETFSGIRLASESGPANSETTSSSKTQIASVYLNFCQILNSLRACTSLHIANQKHPTAFCRQLPYTEPIKQAYRVCFHGLEVFNSRKKYPLQAGFLHKLITCNSNLRCELCL